MGLSAHSHSRYHRRRHYSSTSTSNPEPEPLYGKPPYPAREIAQCIVAKEYHPYSDSGRNVCDYFGPDQFTNQTRNICIAKDDPSSDKKYPWNIFGWRFGKPFLIKTGELDLRYRLDKWWLRIFGEENLVEMKALADQLKSQFGKDILVDMIKGKYYENIYKGER